MRAQKQFAALRKIGAVRAAQVSQSQQALADANARLECREAEQNSALTSLETAAEDWSKYLIKGSFDPELVQAFGAELIEKQEQLQAASTAREEASRYREAQSSQLAARICEETAVRKKQHASGQEIRRQQENKLQTVLEDRTSFLWSRK